MPYEVNTGSGGSDYGDAFDAIVDRYEEATDSKTQVAVLQELINLTDENGDVRGGYNARMELVKCGTFGDQKDKALVAFSWCLAQADNHPGQFDIHSLLWRYKWILGGLQSFRRIPKDKIYQMQDDLAGRLTNCGYNSRPVEFLRWKAAMCMGEMDRAKEYFKKWKKTRRDDMADCEACEQSNVSEIEARLGNPKKSLKLAKKILDGTMTCAEIPHMTYTHLVAQYCKLGKVKEILSLQPAWYRLVNDNSEFLEPVSELMWLVAAAGQFPEAVRMFESHAPWAVETASDDNVYKFYRSATIVFDQLVKSGQSSIKLRMPSGWSCTREDDTYDTGDLAQWFRQETAEAAAGFDARNGNRYYAEQVREADEVAELVVARR